MNSQKHFSPLSVAVLFISAMFFSLAWISPSFAGNEKVNYVEDELLVRPAELTQPEEISAIIKSHGANEVDELPQVRVKRIKVPAHALDQVKAALAKNPVFEFVENNYLSEAALVPSDPYYSSQWHLPNISAPQGWDISTGSNSIVIAIVDTGVDSSHPDLSGKFVPGYNFYGNNSDTSDVHNHGTWVAGSAAAVGNNGTGVAGLAWENLIMPIAISDPNGSSNTYIMSQAVTFAADNGARVINISFGGTGYSQTLQDSINYAWNKGSVIVASAGNEAYSTPTYPAAHDHVIGVSATNSGNALSYFSNYGTWIDVSAPGESILSTMKGGGYAYVSGTSFSSPITAGVIALMLSVNPALAPAQVEEMLKSSTDDLGTAGFDNYYGYGKVNASKALAAALASTNPAPDTTAPVVTMTAPADGATITGIFNVSADASDNVGVAKVEFSVDGTVLNTDTINPYGFSLDTLQYQNGSHMITATAFDAAGNETSSNVLVTFANDNTVPEVTITSPANGATVSGLVDILVDAAADGGIAKVDFLIDGAILYTDTSYPYSFTWNADIYMNGSHDISAVVSDNSGNKAIASISANVSIPDAPIVKITSPASGYTVDGSIMPKTYIYTDISALHKITRMELYVNGLLRFCTSPGYNLPYISLFASDLKVGLNTVKVVAVDETGKTGQDSFTVSLINKTDNINPIVVLDYPAQGATVNGTITVSGVATDNIGVAKLSVYVDNEEIVISPANIGLDGRFSVQYDTRQNPRGISNGQISFMPVVYDAAGKSWSAITRVTVNNISPVTPPNVIITSPASMSQVRGIVPVVVEVSDETAISKVELYVENTLVASNLQPPYILYWDTASNPIKPGLKYISVLAYDSEGTPGGAAITVDVQTPDITLPTVNIISPIEGQVITSDFLIKTEGCDLNGVVYFEWYIDNMPALFGGATGTCSLYSYTESIASLGSGVHNIMATYVDVYGNFGQKTIVFFISKPDTAPPSITIALPANGSTVSGTVSVSAAATDAGGISKVEFSVDGTIASTDATSPYGFIWDSKQYANGSHTITATAYDATGNKASSSVTVTVDNDTTPPTVSITAPVNGSTISGTVNVSASASDAGGMAKVEFMIDGTLVAASTTAPYGYNWDTKQYANGTHSVSATAYDVAGNKNSSSIIVTVNNDLTAPTVSITSPANGSTVSGTVSVSASATDAGGISKVEFSVDGTIVSTDTTSPYGFSWDSKQYANGSHTITATAYDATGNKASSSVTVTVNNDTTPPTVSITAPANGSTVLGTVSVLASASDAGGVAKVEFSIDGILVITITTTPYGFNWDSKQYANGSHTVTATAYDATGNKAGASVTVTVNNDTTPPTVSITSPANGSTVSAAVSVAVSASDAGGITKVEFSIDGTLVGIGTTTPYGFSWDSKQYANGSHTITATAYDTTGNKASSSITVTVNNDTTPPTVSITSPANGSTVSAAVSVSASATDAGGITKVEFSIDGTLVGTSTMAPYGFSWDSKQYANGSHTITATAYDATGNKASSAVTVTVNNDTPPVVTIKSPLDGSKITKTVTVSATATDNTGVNLMEIYIDGALKLSKSGSRASSISYKLDPKTLSAGSHDITVKARDFSGNIGTKSITVYK